METFERDSSSIFTIRSTRDSFARDLTSMLLLASYAQVLAKRFLDEYVSLEYFSKSIDSSKEAKLFYSLSKLDTSLEFNVT